jgi:hypothetical protein
VPTAGVRVCGYSERGIINALLYEIGFSADPIRALKGLLSLITLPGSSRDFSDLQGVEVLVEQSFSDFGDADAVLLVHGPSWRRAIFIEGKVKPSQVKSWTARNAWRAFLARKDNKLDSSNLFTQLYHKVRFVNALRDGGISCVEKGVAFPECSKKAVRKLGKNPVVRRATAMVQEFLDDPLYVAVIPDSSINLEKFYREDLKAGPAADVNGWSIDGWGYLAWEQIESYCKEHGLVNTLRVFDFNRGQLY